MPVGSIINTGYPIVKKIRQNGYPKKVKFNDNMPFRIKFLPGIVAEYRPGNAPPIGIAIIGVNNYIL